MSFLDTLRQGTDSTTTRVLIGMVGVAFIVGIGGSDGNGKSQLYAVVNGQAVTKSEFDQVMRQATRQSGRNLSDSERNDLASDVLERMIAQEVLLSQASSLHVGVAAEEVARILRSQVAFQKDGKFDDASYQHWLREQGQSAERFEDNIRRSLLTNKIRDLAASGVTVTERDVRAAWIGRAMEFDLEYVRIPRTAFLDQVPVSGDEVAAYVTANAATIKTQYDAAFEQSYNLPKRYTLSVIVFRTDLPGVDKEAKRKQADEVAALAANGGDFAELAALWSEDITSASGGNLGQRAPAQLDPVLVTAADAAGVGKVSPAMETGRGYEIVKVSAIDEARVVALEEAQKTIAESMVRDSRVGDVQRAFATKVIAAWTTTHVVPRDLTEPAKLAVEQTGPFSLDALEIPVLGAQPALRKSLETASIGDVFPLALENKGTMYAVSLISKAEPEEADFQAEKSGVRAGLLAAKQEDFYQRWEAALVAEASVERNVNFKSNESTPAE
ncbi:MAG: hypothetical protein EXR69_10845 [Myxococcales bacterium]|nr:hypothetical protein [Myxococcales bacterium]